MNVAIIGSGGREHALALKIKQSPTLENLYIIPGNPGTSLCGDNVELDITNYTSIYKFCKEKNIFFVVIGPEAPLVDGLADYLRNKNINVFGPSAKAARIESQKSFAKKMMIDNNVPTADYKEYTSDQYEKAKNYLVQSKYPLVMKADGLAAGKGVLICDNKLDGIKNLDDLFLKNKFGEAGNKIIIEEFLIGEEVSIFAITDGENFVCLPSAQDHKKIGENDTGLNTGGMGAYSPAPIITDTILREIESTIIKPIIYAMRESGNNFIGCLYAGLILTNNAIKVIEFNCRFGDPETQVVLQLLDGDFLRLLYSASIGKIEKDSVKYNGGCSLCVVASSKGYPENYEKGFEINGLNSITDPNVIIYHAGTKSVGNKIVSNGGRVLGITAYSNKINFKLAKEQVYKNLEKINFDGMYFRRDIAQKILKK
ncbi:MAG: phosphoribosylamine--glycine ligase [Ignavibacteriales bacterium CG_4_9_14_3_um_filter_30_11]|nr:MAG: phosphoribosylamine--glycine ligase [Ignavibacteriales bacterium CG_4_9_14_3_um_filter_30_11]